MNAIAAILQALKTWPETPTLELEDKEPLELAEVYNRLGEIGQVVSALKRIVAEDLAVKLDGRSLRYGETIFRNAAKGSAQIRDDQLWWLDVVDGLKATSRPEDLLAALYPASNVRVTALPKLAAVLGVGHDELKSKHVTYAPATSPLMTMPLSRAPVWLQKLEDGEIR